MIKNILRGIKAYTGVFGLMSKLKLWKYFFIPVIISLVTAIIIGATAYGLSDNAGRFIAKIWIWDFGKSTFTSISSFVGGLFVLVLGLLLYKHIIMALSAPFMSPVSEKIEKHLLETTSIQKVNSNFSSQLSRGIRLNIRNLGKELLISIPIILLGFIPLIGIVSTALLFLIQSYYAGFGNMDYTLERHFNYKESLQFVRKNRGLAIGNGIVFMLFLLIPVVGVIIVMPFSVTAATLKTVEQINLQNKNP